MMKTCLAVLIVALPTAASAQDPVKVDPGHYKVVVDNPGMAQTILAEGPLAVAYRSTAAPNFQEPAGSTHDFDQVVITLGPADMSLSIDGKLAKSKWQRGDVQFVGRGVKREAKNTGGKPVDLIIVGIK